jgi:hypothetical protein
MARWIRLVVALLAFLVTGLPAAVARAGDPPSIGAIDDHRAGTGGPGLAAPHDMPIVLAAGHAIPPLPGGYVTKDLGWLELAYPARSEERVEGIVRDAEAVKAELTSTLGQPVLSRVTVRIAPTVADMARLAPIDAPPPDYAAGVAYHGMHLVLISMLAPRGAEAVDVDEVFRHELAHVALEDAVLGQHVPVWFNEGLAIRLSGELAMARTKTLWGATLSGTLIPLADLDRSFPRDNFDVSIAYAESADFMRFLTRRADRLRFAAMIDRVRGGQAFDRAVAEAYGSDLRRLELEWRSDLDHRFSVIPVLTGGGLLWVLVIGALGAAYVRRRRRARAILARWEREEAIEDAMYARRVAAEEAAAARQEAPAGSAGAPPPSAAAAAAAGRVSVKIEHHGRWHTLH